MRINETYEMRLHRQMSVHQYDLIPECAALNKQIANAYNTMCEFAQKHNVRERQLPAILLRKYNALIATFDALVAERDTIANAHRRKENELLAKEYHIEIGAQYHYSVWDTTGIITINREGYMMFTADDTSMWPIYLRVSDFEKLVRTDTVKIRDVRTVVPESNRAITNIPALERARMTATGHLPE